MSVDTRKYRVYGFSDIILWNIENMINILDESFEWDKKYNFGKYRVINETPVVHQNFYMQDF